MQTEVHILADSTDFPRLGEHEPADFLGTEPQATELEPEEVTEEHEDYSDDPVGVYLREMGSIRLLNRQAEVSLARRIERGNLRMQKALSRSPLVRKMALGIYADIRSECVAVEDLLNLGGPDDAAKRQARVAAMRRFRTLSELEHQLSVLQEKCALKLKSNAQAQKKLARQIGRLTVKCSQEMRGIPFQAAQWEAFRSALHLSSDQLAAL